MSVTSACQCRNLSPQMIPTHRMANNFYVFIRLVNLTPRLVERTKGFYVRPAFYSGVCAQNGFSFGCAFVRQLLRGARTRQWWDDGDDGVTLSGSAFKVEVGWAKTFLVYTNRRGGRADTTSWVGGGGAGWIRVSSAMCLFGCPRERVYSMGAQRGFETDQAVEVLQVHGDLCVYLDGRAKSFRRYIYSSLRPLYSEIARTLALCILRVQTALAPLLSYIISNIHSN